MKLSLNLFQNIIFDEEEYNIPGETLSITIKTN